MIPRPTTLPQIVGSRRRSPLPPGFAAPSPDAEVRVAAFRCYFMNDDRILNVHTHECTDDAEVILKGWELLDSTPEHPALEICEGKRLVGLNR